MTMRDNNGIPVSELSSHVGPDARILMLVPGGHGGSIGGMRGVDLEALASVVWKGRWLVVAVALLVASGGVAYALLAQKWFRAETLIAPVERDALVEGLGGLAGLASLAGVNLSSGSTAESVATLRSREFIAGFISERSLLPVLFARKWDASRQAWKVQQEKVPDLRDGVKLFSNRILGVREDRRTGLISVSVEWHDPQVASDWANELISRVNAALRARALAESQANIDHLTAQLAANNVVGVQQSIGRVLETQLQKLMIAKGTEQFAFRVIDPATPPKEKAKPRRRLIVMVALFLGGLVGVAIVLARSRIWYRTSQGTAAAS